MTDAPATDKPVPAKPGKTDRKKGVIVYPGASAPLLPDRPGGRTKADADAFTAWVLQSVGQASPPEPKTYSKSAHRIGLNHLGLRKKLARKTRSSDA